MSAPLLEVSGLGLQLGQRAPITLLQDVSFALERGEILGIVGESGSGKSLTCRAITQLLPPNIRRSEGKIRLGGREIQDLSDADMTKVRGREIGMIFQNPSSFLDPVMTVGDQIAEAVRVHMGASRREALAEAVEILRQVGIPDPASRARSFPHEFSGGMRQRAMIAGAIACRPKVLIADEPTTALDVTIQAQILRLLLQMRDEKSLGIILITHDLSVVTQTCDRVVVMYAGRLMEAASVQEILTAPSHPYTASLIASQPERARPGEALPAIGGQPPGPQEELAGCRFAPRCARAERLCEVTVPEPHQFAQGHVSACHFAGKVRLQ
ncbi:ABC transporter ATP-binding protein [Pelagibius sp. CAU 1746]|uniref:ABC transporter ATP-binding protein n=1 Tax=Pelagibius sp. CAU 1746 TaxID=3140370 RepID=UPI00325C222E